MEILLIVIATLMGSAFTESVYYDANKQKDCPEFVRDTTYKQRQICYLDKQQEELDAKREEVGN